MSSNPQTVDFASTLQQQLPYVVAASAVAVGMFYLMSRGAVAVPQQAADFYSKPVGTATVNAIAPRRNVKFPEFQHRSIETVQTIHDVLEYAADKFADSPCFGVRPTIKIHEEKKIVDGIERVFTYPELGPFQWQTYKQIHERVLNVGAGLRNLGMQPKDFLAIFEETRLEWSLAARGAYSQSMVVFTVYANLGEEALVFALNQGSIKFIVANASTLKLMGKIAEQVSSLKTIIYVDDAKEADVDALKKKGLNVVSFAEVEALGKSKPVPVTAPKKDDLACIMYTSGSTGMPKGVMIPHRAVLASATVLGGVGLDVDQNDVILHYLPMAHIFAFTLESCFVLRGCSLGFGSPRTLSNVGVRNCEGDMKELRPTLLIAVPAVYEKIKNGVMNKINHSGAVVRTLFSLGFKAKLNSMRTGGTSPVWDKIIFNKMRENVGGRIRFFVSGSAPLSADVQDFIRVCFGAPVLQGYGLTETCSAGCAQFRTDMNTGRIGAPWPSTEVKLVDCGDMGYNTTDKPNPRGEIWIRGPSVSMGYFKDEAKTKEAFTDDGWFMTGDIGAMHPDGTFSIIDRKKHLIKPPHGEYIALEKLESVYRNCSLLDSLCVFVDASHYDCIAMAVPNHDLLMEWATQNKIGTDYNVVVNTQAARDYVLREMVAIGRKLGLKSIETVRNIRLYSEPWTPQNKFLTAAMKLNRPFVTTALKSDIDAMYKELEIKNAKSE